MPYLGMGGAPRPGTYNPLTGQPVRRGVVQRGAIPQGQQPQPQQPPSGYYPGVPELPGVDPRVMRARQQIDAGEGYDATGLPAEQQQQLFDRIGEPPFSEFQDMQNGNPFGMSPQELQRLRMLLDKQTGIPGRLGIYKQSRLG